jgi:CubicO group peptidase (beta-lactamase class C family)
VGELARRADGRTLGTILREDWCGPAGIDFHIGTPDALADRIARIERPKALPNLGEMSPPRVAAFATRWAAPDRGGAEWRRAEIPSANGHCTARAVASLYAVWANGGRLAGRDMISSAVLDAFSRERWQGEDLVLPFRLSWAAGILRNRAGGYGPGPRTLGHSGWGGSFGLADPDRGLSAGYVMNRQSNALMGDPRARRLVAALYACLD